MADLGSAFHEVISERIVHWERNGPEPTEVHKVASKWQVDEFELAQLVARGSVIWKEELRGRFPSPLSEGYFSFRDEEAGIELTGHPDIVSIVGDEVRLPDFKTGFGDYDFTHQLKGYAFLVMKTYPEVQQVRPTIIKVRAGYADTPELWSRAEIENWWAWLTKHLKNSDEHITGAHCKFCPRVFECEARKTQIAACSWIAKGGKIEEKNAAECVDTARQMIRDLNAFIDQMRVETAAQGGKYGKLTIEEQRRQSIIYKKAKTILLEEIGSDRVNELLTISKTAANKAVREMAAHGKKEIAERALYNRLKDAGALEDDTVLLLKTGGK